MTTLAEIEAAADALPPEQKQELMRFLAGRLQADGARMPEQAGALRRSKRGFPISKGRKPFTSEDVARIEAEADLNRWTWLLDGNVLVAMMIDTHVFHERVCRWNRLAASWKTGARRLIIKEIVGQR